MLALAGTVAAREATIPYPPHTIPVEECCSEQLVLHWQWWDVVESCLCQGLTTWELYLWWITWHCFSRDGWSLSFALYSPEDSSGRGTHHLANPPGFLVSGSPAVHCSHKWSPKSNPHSCLETSKCVSCWQNSMVPVGLHTLGSSRFPLGVNVLLFSSILLGADA